mgnify:CR=1 FL=1
MFDGRDAVNVVSLVLTVLQLLISAKSAASGTNNNELFICANTFHLVEIICGEDSTLDTNLSSFFGLDFTYTHRRANR